MRKIFSVILIVIGILVIVEGILVELNAKTPQHATNAFLLGYYLFFFIELLMGAGIIFLGIRLRSPSKRKMRKKLIQELLPDNKDQST
jgi:uncharacterized membrane protein